MSGLGATLFFGGWSAPLQGLQFIPSWIWFFGKVMMAIFVFIWVRGTLPRLRQDQLMNFAWKFVLPLTLLNLVVTAMWRFMGESWLRWVVSTVILAGAYVLMGRVGMHSKHFAPRKYRYAE
jgi:NADH-quinone oxidoreductase subunit H